MVDRATGQPTVGQLIATTVREAACIKTVMYMWLDAYPDDFRELPNFPCLRHIITFSNTHMKDSDLAKRAQQKIDTFVKEDEPQGPVRGKDSKW
jgi:hypothetical protein